MEQTWVPKTTDKVEKNGKTVEVPWKGPAQYTNAANDLMMLETDMTMIRDPKFSKWAHIYAKDQKRFFADFSKAFATLIELGCSDKVLKSSPMYF